MKVEVAYARPDVQVILEVEVAEGATVEEAIRRSGILERFPEIDLSAQKVGVFARVVPLSQTLREWDRVEIYRPLIADPKAARRRRARKDGANEDGPRKGGANKDGPRKEGARKEGARKQGAREPLANKRGTGQEGAGEAAPAAEKPAE